MHKTEIIALSAVAVGLSVASVGLVARHMKTGEIGLQVAALVLSFLSLIITAIASYFIYVQAGQDTKFVTQCSIAKCQFKLPAGVSNIIVSPGIEKTGLAFKLGGILTTLTNYGAPEEGSTIELASGVGSSVSKEADGTLVLRIYPDDGKLSPIEKFIQSLSPKDKAETILGPISALFALMASIIAAASVGKPIAGGSATFLFFQVMIFAQMGAVMGLEISETET
mgnify:CR=1 FL=1